MSKNIYHILNFIPGIEKEDMTVGREKLAEQLVSSGRFRIDAGTNRINFARFYIPNLRVSMMFSYRELYEESLLPRTKEIIASQIRSQYRGEMLRNKVSEHLSILRKELKKYAKIDYDDEMRLARLVVQATHPAVMMLILAEGTEIFLSYSYNIGDMLDIGNWRSAGNNSGMQSTDGLEAAVFISCGGDPLAENSEEFSFYGNGWPAIARLIVIGGQELGHYSDIRRNEYGQQVGRYSANLAATKATEVARKGRINDIIKSKNLLRILGDFGFEKLLNEEIALKFYRKNKRRDLLVFFTQIKIFILSLLLKRRLKHTELEFLLRFFKEKYPCIMIQAMFGDMLFNLAPVADVYQNKNKQIEEAIACVEALARVPQQVNKWGHAVVGVLMGNLYELYYEHVIPGCITAFEVITAKKYRYDPTPMPKSLWYKIKKLFKKGIKEIRDVEV